DAGPDLAGGLPPADAGHAPDALLELGRAQGEVLGDVVDDLRAGVRGHPRPPVALQRGLDRVAHVLAVRQRRLAHALAARAQHWVAVVGVRPPLRAGEVDLRGAVQGRVVAPRGLARAQGGAVGRRGQLRLVVVGQLPLVRGAEVLVHALAPALAPEARLAVAAEAGGGVEEVRRVHPHDARLELGRHVQGQVHVLRPDAGGEPVAGVVRELHGLGGGAERQAHDDGPEDLLLGDRRGGRDVREERRREVPALLGRRPRRLEARGARGLALLHQARDLLELDGRDDRADVYRLVERRALAQVLHALAQLRLHARRHALLHEQAAAGAADLALVEPDRVDDALDGGVEVGVLEHDEGRLAAQLQGELQLAARGLAADDAPHLRRAR